MKISARNQIKGTVISVTEGAVNGVVKIDLGAGNVATADITMNSIEELGLAEGKTAYAVIKATDVMFATGKVAGLSARNQFAGTVGKLKKGAVNGRVSLNFGEGQHICGAITNASIDELGLEVGSEAVAIVKATSIMVGVDE
ncbi:MAG: TOBE domain-containing protein [Coriobacteriia bacterium]|nr:TOBE domain-containing protein [Coriobacteriia bacterium]